MISIDLTMKMLFEVIYEWYFPMIKVLNKELFNHNSFLYAIHL